jgi:hypothetical protein
MHEHGIGPACVVGLSEFSMLWLVIALLVPLGFWGVPAGARAFYREPGKPIGWMSAEWLAEHRNSHAQ